MKVSSGERENITGFGYSLVTSVVMVERPSRPEEAVERSAQPEGAVERPSRPEEAAETGTTGAESKGPWVFGMLLRRTGELRLFRVQRRDAATLIPLIIRHVAAGSSIHSDEWAAYRQLGALPGMGYIHRTVNHQ
ncbi:hypothetical protein FJT64_022682 [Amphibalanus amphitrite]|uniref:ISXO2-like transposase domain-containing protein n=1 Tax=Amphibalanus amphitrite TaxID=1232801 RepID=A0A6A4WKJ6_AMPAM|nr:hypothetical protein FJT64_022682 [Amphibalanus amphitrite]